MRLAGARLLLGLGSAAVVGFLLRSRLYNVSATDPITFVVAPAVFMAVAVASAILPARRAARVDPQVALRHH